MKILITEPLDYSTKALQILQTIGEVRLGVESVEELHIIAQEYDVFCIRLGYDFNRDLLEKCDQLKYIITPTTGLNHIDMQAADEMGIKVISLFREEDFLSTIPSTAEHTWGLLLALLRKIPAAFNAVKEGSWQRDNFKSHNLNSQTIGILGLGRVGKQIAAIAKAFNMNVLGYDSRTIHVDGIEQVASLTDLIKASDILTIHIDLNKTSVELINSTVLSFAKESVCIINTSRGEIVNELDIVSALKHGKIRGYATDVLVNENDEKHPSNNKLVQYAMNHNNIIITPHIAGATYESMWMTEEFVIDKFLNLTAKKK